MTVVCSLHFTQHGCQNIEIILQLVSDAPEAERRMIAIFLTYTLCFGTQELDRSRIFSKRHTPYRKLYLHIESNFIGYIERCFRRTPGMETEMIHSIFACRSIKFFPRSLISRRCSCQRKNAALQCTTKEYRFFIHHQFVSFMPYITQSESFGCK